MSSPPDPVLWWGRTVPQSIPNAVWTAVEWDWAPLDTGGLHDPDMPSVVPLPQSGLYAAVAGVSFALSPDGYRAVRFSQEGLVVATVGPVPGVGQVTGFDCQTVQCVMQPGTHLPQGSSFRVEAWQDSGGPLDVVPDGAAGPILMMGYLGPVTL